MIRFHFQPAAVLTALIGLLSISALAQEVKPVGLIVVNDGTTVEVNCPAYEYRSLEVSSGAFKAVSLSGQPVSGLKSHLVANVEYGTLQGPEAIQKLLVISKAYPKSAKALAVQIERLKSMPAEAPKPPPVDSELTRKTIPSLTGPDGRKYSKLFPKSIALGRIGMIHESGSLGIPARCFPLADLIRLGECNAALQYIAEFSDLVATFEPKLLINLEIHTGVRLISLTDNTCKIQTDKGIRTVDRKQMKEEVLSQLLATKERFEKWQLDVNERILDQIKQEIAAAQYEQDQYNKERDRLFNLRKAEIERDAQFWGAMGSAMDGFFGR